MTRQGGRSTVWIILAIYVAYFALKLVINHMDISRFVVAGDLFFQKGQLLYPVYVQPHSAGYDGQFYYRLALDPFTSKHTAFGITMDQHPVVRAQRILYPAVVWLLSGGNGYLVPYMMVAVNVASLVWIAVQSVRLVDHYGLDRRLAILFPLFPGFILSLSRDTLEIFATAIAISALLAAVRKRYVAASLFACAAVLARETTLLYLASFGLFALYDCIAKRDHYGRAVLFAAPAILFVVWQAILRHIWGSLPTQDLGPHDLAPIPFLEYGRWLIVHANNLTTAPISYRVIYTFASYLLIPAFFAFILYGVKTARRRDWRIILSWIAYASLVTIFTGAIWVEPYGFLRVLSDFYVLGIAAMVSCGQERSLRRAVPLIAVTWLATVAYTF